MVLDSLSMQNLCEWCAIAEMDGEEESDFKDFLNCHLTTRAAGPILEESEAASKRTGKKETIMNVEIISAENWVEDKINVYRYADGTFRLRRKNSDKFRLEPGKGGEDYVEYMIRGEGWADDYSLGSVFKFDDDDEYTAICFDISIRREHADPVIAAAKLLANTV